MTSPIVEATHPSAEKVQKYYAWRASNYDAGAGFEVEHHAEALRLAEVQAGQRVLDVACGTGRETVGLAQAVGTTGQVDALDLSDAISNSIRPIQRQARSCWWRILTKSPLHDVPILKITFPNKEIPCPSQRPN